MGWWIVGVDRRTQKTHPLPLSLSFPLQADTPASLATANAVARANARPRAGGRDGRGDGDPFGGAFGGGGGGDWIAMAAAAMDVRGMVAGVGGIGGIGGGGGVGLAVPGRGGEADVAPVRCVIQ